MSRLRGEGPSGQDEIIEHIGSMELGRRTGASYRQIDYWARGKVIPTISRNTPGTGNPRDFDAAIVPAVKLLVKMSDTFHQSIYRETLKLVFDNYYKGCVVSPSGITISWEVK